MKVEVPAIGLVVVVQSQGLVTVVAVLRVVVDTTIDVVGGVKIGVVLITVGVELVVLVVQVVEVLVVCTVEIEVLTRVELEIKLDQLQEVDDVLIREVEEVDVEVVVGLLYVLVGVGVVVGLVNEGHEKVGLENVGMLKVGVLKLGLMLVLVVLEDVVVGLLLVEVEVEVEVDLEAVHVGPQGRVVVVVTEVNKVVVLGTPVVDVQEEVLVKLFVSVRYSLSTDCWADAVAT